MNYVNDRHLYVGKRVIIHAYKFNGWLYRSWEYPVIVAKTDDFYILGSDDAEIITAEFNTKRYFKSSLKKRCFWVFFKDKWYNMVITIQPDNRLSYYINLSSKFIYEESTFKYYDFDLDFKIFSNGSWCEVDVNEFKEGIERYGYSTELINIIQNVEKEVINLIKNNHFINHFNQAQVQEYSRIFDRVCTGDWRTRKLVMKDSSDDEYEGH